MPDLPSARWRHDLRMPLVGAGAWTGGIAAHVLGPASSWAVAGAVVLGVVVWWRRGAGLLVAGCLVAAAVAGSTLLRHQAVVTSPVADLAERRAVVAMEATVTSDPWPVTGPWGEQLVVRAKVHVVTGRGTTYRLGAPVLVLADERWHAVALGERLRFTGRLAPPDGDPALAAVVTGPREPVRIRGPDPWWRGAAAVRSSLREAVSHRPEEQRALVPALVVGDDAGLPPGLEEDFRTTGLTHLTAVSGTNLTLLLGFLLLVARPLGVRGRWLHLVAAVGIVGFVLLARTEPSVLRAAVMGAVGLFALASDGRRRGLRALGVAVTVLLLVSPALAMSAGFTLSVLATAGIVVVGPPLQAALSRWLPTTMAVALAVPLSAQLACTPVVAALAGEVSLVAVVANVLVAPVVGPATVLGLAGGLLGLLADPLGQLAGTAAAWCVAWIVLVAERGAALPAASVTWGTGGWAIGGLVLLCLLVAALLPWLLRHRSVTVVLGAAVLAVVTGAPGRIGALGGWPPDDWVLVACDVGQGDALVLAAGPGTAVVVDAGPDAGAVDGCLDRLEVTAVPLVVLTHFHADHVAGLSGVLSGRRVTAVEVSPMLDPHPAVDDVRRLTGRAGVPLAPAPHGTTRRLGAVTLQVLWPDLAAPVVGPGDGSAANDASVVLLVETRGLRLLLTGDLEPPGQERLAALLPGLRVDVLKVPHHGSAHQVTDWLTSLDAAVAVVSVGDDNDYGHPHPRLLDALEGAGAEVARTDEQGDVAVVVGPDGPEAVGR